MKTILLALGLFSATAIFAQTEEAPEEKKERSYQLEFTGGIYGRRYYNTNYLIGAGINVPGRKTNWYTNYAVHISHYGPFTRYGSDFHTISAGKHYQLKKGDFYASFGMNAGIFATYSGRDNYNSGYGLALMPRVELGVNANKVILAVGMHAAAGYGYFTNVAQPELYNNGWGLSGTLSPYVKVILK